MIKKENHSIISFPRGGVLKKKQRRKKKTKNDRRLAAKRKKDKALDRILRTFVFSPCALGYE
jgi:hypothetical protein